MSEEVSDRYIGISFTREALLALFATITLAMITSAFLFIIWSSFSVYWLFSSAKVKTDIKVHGNILLYVKIRYVAAVVALLQLIEQSDIWLMQSSETNIFLEILGALLVAAGISFSIWARHNLGANWSSRPAIKSGHQLIMSGPYRLVRHPIYGGLLVALLGSVLIGIHLWIFLLIYFAPLYVSKILNEDRLMLKQFPREYPPYKQHTKAIIPYII